MTDPGDRMNIWSDKLARRGGAGAVSAEATRLALWLGLVLTILSAAYATHLRLGQLEAWSRNPGLYMASGVPTMTTLDAYYSLRIARREANGIYRPGEVVSARHYSRPTKGDPDNWYIQREPGLPLLSGTLAAGSWIFDISVERAGLLISPILSSLFMIPLFLCCWRLGAPAAGLMGGLIATFCIEYYQRTSAGWVDTDALNLFFPWTVTLLFLSIRADQRREISILLSAAAGTTLYVFFLWYEKQHLTLIFACAFVIHLRMAGVPWRRSALCVATLVITAGPEKFGGALDNLGEFGARYLWSSATQLPTVSSAIQFPEVWPTISEVRKLHWTDTLGRILTRPDTAAIGLMAFVAFAFRRWRDLAALGPVLLLGSLALMSSRRFVVYLAPFVGIGWGFICCVITKALFNRRALEHDEPARRSDKGRYVLMARTVRSAIGSSWFETAAAYAAVIAVFTVWFLPPSVKAYVPRPAIPGPVLRDLQILAGRLPADSRIWTWWDFGFAIVDATGFGVYHDGSAQYTPQTNLIAASFVRPDQREMHDVINFVDREGNKGILRVAAHASSFDNMLQSIRGETRSPSIVPIFVMFTPDMMLKYAGMRRLGKLKPETAYLPESPGIRWLQCDKIVNDVLHCSGQSFDLRTGRIDQLDSSSANATTLARLRRAVIVENGSVARQRDYAATSLLTLEILVHTGAPQAVYLLDETAFHSNLNQMFFLGRFDPTLFESVFNDFPYMRAFRVREAIE